MSKFRQVSQFLGLHPLVGFGLFATDWMLFGGEVATLGASIPITIAAGLLLTFPSILIQRFGFKDSWGLAIGKGLLVGILTAIPAPLPSIVPFLGGVLGVANMVGGKDALVPKDVVIDVPPADYSRR